MKTTTIRGGIMTAVALMFVCMNAPATTLTPVSAVQNSGNASIYGSVTTLIDGAGLSGIGPVESQLHSEYPVGAPGGGMWVPPSYSPATPSVTFDLGAVYTVSTLYIWNYAEATYSGGGTALGYDGTARGTKSLDVSAGLTPSTTFAQNFTVAKITPAATESAVIGYANWGADFTVAAQVFTLTTPVTARYITFDLLSSYNNANSGLSEVRFGGIAAVPEPSSIVLLGLGVMGLMGWKARKILRAS